MLLEFASYAAIILNRVRAISRHNIEDVDNNGDVEVLDMVLVSSHFGEEW